MTEAPLMQEPSQPPVWVGDDLTMNRALRTLADEAGPVALDAERAHGFRYDARAWLVQVKRGQSPVYLIDPAAFDWDLSRLQEVMGPQEWVLHAASQDIPCLRDCGLLPTRIFDTELAGRLLHDPRVGLGTLIEQELGVRLAKEHSAADWSQRPISNEMCAYAALDVELLVELREKIAARLEDADKMGWAEEEFTALVATADVEADPPAEPWRRTKGAASLRMPAQLALVRAMWEARDEIAQRLDKGPSRILIDVAISEAAALVNPKVDAWPDQKQLRRIDGFKRRNAQRHMDTWLAAVDRARSEGKRRWPAQRAPLNGPPRQPRNWERNHPDEYARWLAVRPVVNTLAEHVDVPPENLLSPAALRHLAWEPPSDITARSVAALLQHRGARAWQLEILAEPLADALAKQRGATAAE